MKYEQEKVNYNSLYPILTFDYHLLYFIFAIEKLKKENLQWEV